MTIPTGTDAWTEADLLRNVREWAELCGWLVGHAWTSVHSPAGEPDLRMVRGRRIVWAELKSARGKPSEAQLLWAKALQEAGAEYYLWRPADFDTIVEVLR